MTYRWRLTLNLWRSTVNALAQPALAARLVGRRYVQLVLVLGPLIAIGPLTIDTYLPALPQLTAELGATDSQAQLTITGLLLGLGLGQLIIDPLFRRRRSTPPAALRPAAHALCPCCAPSHRPSRC